jgi:hypothetical protein
MNVPTVVQLYTSKPILLDNTSKVTGYTAMTYQAIQVGSFSDDQELKNRHQNPDLGVWNCRVGKEVNQNNIQVPLLDSLLAKVTSHVHTFCWTVDLSDSTTVEPTISLLQGALVRHLIEKKTPQEEDTRKTSTTSLYQLQATQFGLATDDKESNISEKNIDESSEAIKTSIMICAILPIDKEEVSESAYKTKQSNALVIYHLRKFAAAINASLCFVQPEEEKQMPVAVNPAKNTSTSSMNDSQQPQQQRGVSESSQPAVSFDELSKLWRDLALDKKVWDTDFSNENSNANDAHEVQAPALIATPLYGPERHQEEFIETALLRNAHYPGHWEASKDSLWVALPTTSESLTADSGASTGDEGWLVQLRESIASAANAPKPVIAPEETKAEEKTNEKDAAVSDFFASLLKDA